MNIPIGCLIKIHLLKLIYAHVLNQAEINLCAYMTSRREDMRDKFCSAPLSIIGGVLTIYFFLTRVGFLSIL